MLIVGSLETLEMTREVRFGRAGGGVRTLNSAVSGYAFRGFFALLAIHNLLQQFERSLAHLVGGLRDRCDAGLK